jgi:hypothetical protein
MEIKKELNPQKSSNFEESWFHKICGLFIFLFPAVLLLINHNSLTSAFTCISAIYVAILWLSGNSELNIFRSKQRIDFLEQRIAALEKQLGQQNQE